MKSALALSLSALVGALSALQAQPSLTLYNGKFAVVREVVPLELKAGPNQVRYSGVTAGLEPSSVILRDPTGKVALGILEQDFLNDSANESALLAAYEGQVIGFLIRDAHGGTSVTQGKVVRAGREAGEQGGAVAPLIEWDGKLLFELPGRPLFPAMKEDNILKPLLTWKIQSPAPSTLEAELAYLTSGFDWDAHYNLILEANQEKGDLNCWVTIRNYSGKTFEEAQIKLMGGDIHRLPSYGAMPAAMAKEAVSAAMAPAEMDVQEKKFDDFHLYTVSRPITLRDGSVKQIEFARAAAIPTRRIYRFEAASSEYPGQPVLDRDWIADSEQKVVSRLEFENQKTAGLGLPLPSGVMRVYRKEGTQVEFIGEDRLDHSPAGAKLKVVLGNAFDLSGNRRRADYKIDQRAHTLDEAFEIVLKNGGKTAVEVTVVEHLTRTAAWKITRESARSTPVDSHTVHFLVPVAAESEITLSYAVRYTW
jgi:hypothetical protein